MSDENGLSDHMDQKTCYEWGNLFASPWDELVIGMNARALAQGLTQSVEDGCIIWKHKEDVRIRFVFVDDPSDIESIRSIYNNEANIKASVCFIIVKQPDPSDSRGDIIFDIFRMNHESYLWHFYRVYTPPKKKNS